MHSVDASKPDDTLEIWLRTLITHQRSADESYHIAFDSSPVCFRHELAHNLSEVIPEHNCSLENQLNQVRTNIT